jgi:nickel/cobalt transporter (NicO) family protein
MLKTFIGKLLLIAMLLVANGASAQNLDMFGRPASDASGASGTSGVSGVSTTLVQPAEKPQWMRQVVGTSIRWQSELNARLQDALPDRDAGLGSIAALTIVLLSFAYGVLHALGPGHGKTVVGTYLVSHPSRIGEAMLLGVWSATAQALSAIALVGGAAWLAKHGFDGVLTQAARLELVSYAALLLVGLWTAWSIVTRRDCCKPARVHFSSFRLIDAFDEDNAAYLGSKLSMQRRTSRQNIFLTGLAVGIRPCAGSIFVLIAGLDRGAFGVGVDHLRDRTGEPRHPSRVLGSIIALRRPAPPRGPGRRVLYRGVRRVAGALADRRMVRPGSRLTLHPDRFTRACDCAHTVRASCAARRARALRSLRWQAATRWYRAAR